MGIYKYVVLRPAVKSVGVEVHLPVIQSSQSGGREQPGSPLSASEPCTGVGERSPGSLSTIDRSLTSRFGNLVSYLLNQILTSRRFTVPRGRTPTGSLAGLFGTPAREHMGGHTHTVLQKDVVAMQCRRRVADQFFCLSSDPVD